MLRWMLVVLAAALLPQSVALGDDQIAPLPRFCQADNPAVACIGPFHAIRSHPEHIYLTGDILDDAPAAFLRVMRFQPKAKVLVLQSNGGLVDPALILAKEVRSRGLNTYIPASAECNSTCSFVFFAGVQRKIDGKLGVRQVWNTGNDPRQWQATLADVFTTLRAFDVADEVISRMLSTSPDETHYFDRSEIAKLGIEHGSLFGTSTIDTAQSSGQSPPTSQMPAALNPDGNQSLLLEASDDGATGAVPFSGTVEWSKGQDETGLPTLVGRASIPARNLGVDVIIRKNIEADLPASHVVEVSFRVPNSFIGGSVAGLPGVLLKNEELVQGEPLVGASARMMGNSFLFALSASPEDVIANSDLLTTRKWIDLAIIYATGKRAIITLEKGDAAGMLFKEVFNQWSATHPPSAPDNITLVPKTRSSSAEPKRHERFVKVVEDENLQVILLSNGFTIQTSEMMVQTLGAVIDTSRFPAGTLLHILLGPSRNAKLLIPYRLTLYAPDGSARPRHLATASLTDRGTFDLGLEPKSVPAFEERHEVPRSPSARRPDGKGDRLKVGFSGD